MTGFVATLAIAGTVLVLGLVIARFSNRQKASEKIDQDVHEVRETYAEHR